MLVLAEIEPAWYLELVKQVPAAAVMLIALLAFLRYLAGQNQMNERLEERRQAHLKEMSDSCHAAHKTVVEESNAAIGALTAVLSENNRILARNEAALLARDRRDEARASPRHGPGRD